MALVEGKVLITGATGGIGQAIARAFAARGADVLVSGRRQDVLESLAGEVGGRAIPCDLAQRGDIDRLVSEAGDVGILIANAALPASGVFTHFEQEEIDGMLEVNLRAPIALARAIAPRMVERGRGHLVFISSLSGRVASPASAIYSATKFGLRGFALGIREDLHEHGVGVSVVLPGFVSETGMFADSGAQLPRGVGTRTPEDVAAAVIRAVERNRAEVAVAPLGLRVGSAFGGVAPGLASSVSRRLGGAQLAASIAEGQRDKR